MLIKLSVINTNTPELNTIKSPLILSATARNPFEPRIEIIENDKRL